MFVAYIQQLYGWNPFPDKVYTERSSASLSFYGSLLSKYLLITITSHSMLLNPSSHWRACIRL